MLSTDLINRFIGHRRTHPHRQTHIRWKYYRHSSLRVYSLGEDNNIFGNNDCSVTTNYN